MHSVVVVLAFKDYQVGLIQSIDCRSSFFGFRADILFRFSFESGWLCFIIWTLATTTANQRTVSLEIRVHVILIYFERPAKGYNQKGNVKIKHAGTVLVFAGSIYYERQARLLQIVQRAQTTRSSSQKEILKSPSCGPFSLATSRLFCRERLVAAIFVFP